MPRPLALAEDPHAERITQAREIDMVAARTISIKILLVSLTVLPTTPLAAVQTGAPPVRSNLILPNRQTSIPRGATLLDLVRSRLPVTVQQGRFMTQDGIAPMCIQPRRSAVGRAAVPESQPPFCEMIVVYVDGTRIGGVASFLAHERADGFESIELVSASEAMQRYGPSSNGRDVLVIWSRGRGPHVRSLP